MFSFILPIGNFDFVDFLAHVWGGVPKVRGRTFHKLVADMNRDEI